MQKQLPLPPKPRSEIWRSELTRLPPLTIWRSVVRSFLRGLTRLVIRICARLTIRGLENFPAQGPALVVTNHLGDADVVLIVAYLPILPEALAKVELYDYPILGKVIEAYGVIWVHRGQPDRRAIQSALKGLAEGRIIAMAPEGRYSLVGGLEQGMGGAAYLALKAGVPVIPVAVTGTKNEQVYGFLRRLRRAPVTFTVGQPFILAEHADRREAVRQGTGQIMQTLADLLPDEYRGVYGSQKIN